VPNDHPQEIAAHFAKPPESFECLLAVIDGEVVGFAEVGLRPYAEDCRTSPVGYLEGIYVTEARRGQGVGRTLVAAAEQWARDQGCAEMASDRELVNEASAAFHAATGFQEAARIVCYRKAL
jgi:aminoglycoside 6'-N-acetyltransferase I